MKRLYGYVRIFLVCSLYGPCVMQAVANGPVPTIDPAVGGPYVFLTDQSTVVQTGGYTGVHETYPVEGSFQLAVDVNEGVASFAGVDANLLNPTGFLYTQDLGELLNMTALQGTVVNETTIEFSGKTASNNQSIVLTLTFGDDSVRIVGGTLPVCCDFFDYHLDAVAQKRFAGGTGEPNDPFQIATAQQLCSIGSDPNLLDKHYVLIDNIDLDPCLPGGQVFNRAVIAPYTNVTMWQLEEYAFSGSFDGQGHTITKMTIDASYSLNQYYLGLFGRINSGAQVFNLDLIDANVVGDMEKSAYVCILAATNYGGIQHCTVSGSVKGASIIGGLPAINYGEVSHCVSICRINNSKHSSGGLLAANSGTLSHCMSTCTISGDSNTGGLAGENSVTIENCHSFGMVSGRERAGGLVAGNNLYGVISHCTHVGTVTGDESTGGLVGLNGGNDPAICKDILAFTHFKLARCLESWYPHVDASRSDPDSRHRQYDRRGPHQGPLQPRPVPTTLRPRTRGCDYGLDGRRRTHCLLAIQAGPRSHPSVHPLRTDTGLYQTQQTQEQTFPPRSQGRPSWTS